MEGGEIGLIVVCALVWLLVAVSAVAAYRYQQRASKFNSEARNLLQRFIAEHSDRREHANARLQSSRSLENLLVHEITDAEQTEPGVSVLRTSSFRASHLATPAEKVLRATQALEQLALIRSLNRGRSAASFGGLCYGMFTLLCGCGGDSVGTRNWNQAVDLEEELLQRIGNILTTSHKFNAPDLRAQIAKGTIPIDDEGVKEWLMSELRAGAPHDPISRRNLTLSRQSSHGHLRHRKGSIGGHSSHVTKVQSMDLLPGQLGSDRALSPLSTASNEGDVSQGESVGRIEEERFSFGAGLHSVYNLRKLSTRPKTVPVQELARTLPAGLRGIYLKEYEHLFVEPPPPEHAYDDDKVELGEPLEQRMHVPLALPSNEEFLVRDAVADWAFPVFELAEATNGNPVPLVGYALLRRHNLIEELDLNPATLQSALVRIGRGYHVDNPFHNAIHAADVAQSVSFFLSGTRLHRDLQPYETFACIMAALCHDFDHPGVNNNFLNATQHPLSLCYNDVSVLENHHASSSLSMLASFPDADILADLEPDVGQSVRSIMIQLIVATDLALNFDIIGDFKRRFNRETPGPEVVVEDPAVQPSPSPATHTVDSPGLGQSSSKAHVRLEQSERYLSRSAHLELGIDSDHEVVPHKDGDEPPLNGVGGLTRQDASVTFDVKHLQDNEARMLVLKLCIKCADLGHPAKLWDTHYKWTQMVSEEFYRQGEREVSLGLPISPFMDRSKHDNLPKQQIGFFDFLVLPLWNSFLGLFAPYRLQICRQCLTDNRTKWEELAAEAEENNT